MSAKPKAQIEIPSFSLYLSPSVHFVLGFAQQLGVEGERLQNLRKALEGALRMVMEKNVEGQCEDPITIEVGEATGKIFVQIHNQGVPIFSEEDTRAKNSSGLRLVELSKLVHHVTIENQGRRGQAITLEVSLGEDAAKKSLQIDDLPIHAEVNPQDIVLRRLEADEAPSLSQLFYFIYGYNYINELVYFPQKIAEMIRDGRLVSTVAALPDGRLLGHVGLLRWNEAPPVFEACLGVVDPRVKSQGLFKRLFHETMNAVQATPMQYCFFDCVTNIDFSQRLVSTYGAVDMALFVGCQTKLTQARLSKLGLGADPKEMERYSILYGALPRQEQPFGAYVELPYNIGENLGFLLEPFNLNWSPSPRFSTLNPGGSYKTLYQPAQLSVNFDFQEPGLKALSKILEDWRSLLRNGYQYAGVDVPVEISGMGMIYDILAKNGFFVGGFIPYRNSDKLAFRFQSIGPTKVAFDQIKVFTPAAKRLLEIIRTDYERNCVI
jgi:hypothetical protein